MGGWEASASAGWSVVEVRLSYLRMVSLVMLLVGGDWNHGILNNFMTFHEKLGMENHPN